MVPEAGGSSPLRHPIRSLHSSDGARPLHVLLEPVRDAPGVGARAPVDVPSSVYGCGMAVEETAFPFVPGELRERAARWGDLKRWERKELAQALRSLGLSYREIAALVPVAKGTLSDWCKDLPLTDEQYARLSAKRPAAAVRRALGARRRKEALERHAAVDAAARLEAASLLHDPFWVAGVVAYWSEGAKRSSGLELSNSDPELVRLFIRWLKRYLDVDADRLTVQMHLHSGQDDGERRAYWSRLLSIPETQFQRTFVKKEGTGHRKNLLYNGTVKVRVRRSRTLLYRVMGWIAASSGIGDDGPAESI